VTPTPATPLIESGVMAGSHQVCGRGRPNLSNGCIEIRRKDGSFLGSGGTDASGLFCISVNPSLEPGDRIFPQDVCSPFSPGDPLVGPIAVVPGPVRVPTSGAWGLLGLTLALFAVGALLIGRRAIAG